MTRKVTYAKTQTGLFAPNIGDLGTVFPPQSKTLAGLSMELNVADSLVITFSYGGRNHNILVPAANVVLASFVTVEST